LGFRYLVKVAGRQETATAFDIVHRGSAKALVLADRDRYSAFKVAAGINELLGNALCAGEVMDVASIGEAGVQAEDFVASEVTSDAARTYPGKLRNYQEKIPRYPGHCEVFPAFKRLGFNDVQLIDIKPDKASPREVFHALFKPNVRAPDDHLDICFTRVTFKAVKEGKESEVTLELVDTFDESAGFTARERLTYGMLRLSAKWP